MAPKQILNKYSEANKLKWNNPEYKKRVSNNISKSCKCRTPWIKEKRHTEETKQKIKESKYHKNLKGTRKGKLNHMFGKRLTKEHKEKIMEMIKKAGSEEYETSWNKGGVFSTSKNKVNVKRGKKSKAKGARFEKSVRNDLEEKGRIVDKWSNNIDLEEGKIIAAKKKFNPFSKAMMLSSGFPDFISIKKISEGSYNIIGVEVKMNGILSKVEKEKCRWYLKNGIFSNIWIAKAEQLGRKINIKYEDFEERYGK